MYIGNGSCKYLFETGIDWNTLSWVAAPTKKKLLLDKENKTERMTRYIYFKTYDKLIAYIQKNPGDDPRIGMNAPIKQEYLDELKEIRKNKLERITK